MRLVPVENDPFAEAPASASGLVPVDYDPFAVEAKGQAPDVVLDVAQTVAPGLARGVASLIGLPNAGIELLDRYAAAPAAALIGRGVRSVLGQQPSGTPLIPDESPISKGFPSQEQILKPVEAVAGPLYKPKTVAGEYANTLAEFAPNALFGGATALQKAAQVVVPALASETAGQGARVVAPGAEGVARFVGALGGGVGTALAQAPRGGNVLAGEALKGFTPDEIAAAQALRAEARALPNGGIELPLDEALNRVTDGRASRLSQLSRVVTNSGDEGGQMMSRLYAERPAQIDRAARGTFGLLGPQSATPSSLGLEIQAAARQGVEATPEGLALAQARAAAGPRITPDEAGQVIQPALRAQADLREAVRKGQADRDYRMAREAPENVGVERAVTVERPGEPIVTYPQGRPQFTEDAPRPLDDFLRGKADASGPAAESLARFVARNGGIKLDGDARAADFQKYNIPGLGTVARENGKSIDNFWREELITKGYLKADPDGGAARDITNELLRKLQNEQRGLPSYPIGVERGATRGVVSREADEYANDLSLAESRLNDDLDKVGIPPESLDPDVRSRALGAMMRGETNDGADAYMSVVRGMRDPPAPYVKSTTVQEEIPDVRFGQVNPQAALEAVLAQSRFAKGDVRPALRSVERDLMEAGGTQTDMSVAGLLKARERLDQQIQAAAAVGDGTKVRDLQIVRGTLDRDLKAVPEVATADANFSANSRPLEPFAGNAPLARVVRRDDLTGRMATPTEQVPGLLQGASARRALLENGTPAAREAADQFLTTQILDSATDARGQVSADRLLVAMRDNADVLAQSPAVRERLEGIVRARDGLAPVEKSPLGLLAQTDDTAQATNILFPPRPRSGGQGEIGQAASVVARNNPRAVQSLTRGFLEDIFNASTKDNRGLASQYGGAGFASAVRGNAQKRANLGAVTSALPNAETAVPAMDRLLRALEATGYKPQKGSDTFFNIEIGKQLENNTGPLSAAISDAASKAAAGAIVAGPGGAGGGALLGLKKGLSEANLRRRVRGNTEELARVLTDRRSVDDLLALLPSKRSGLDANLFLTRLLAMSNAGGNSGNQSRRKVP